MTGKPTARPTATPASGITLGDIYFTLFRHKGKIGVIVGFGLAVALALPLFRRLPYQSEAKLLIRYVLENKTVGQSGPTDTRVKSPDERGENIINTELEILTSLDLAQDVATNIGPEKILARAGGGNNLQIAAGLVHLNLIAEAPKKSSVIRIVFQHPDPEIVQPLLEQVITSYLKKHGEIHRSANAFDDLMRSETDQLHSKLQQTEDELRGEKAKANIFSVEDSKKLLSEQTAKIQQAILDARAELAERQASANELARLLHTKPVTANTNEPAVTNEMAIPPDISSDYKRVCSLLEVLEKDEQNLLRQFTTNNALVRDLHHQILDNQFVRKEIEDEYPGVLTTKVAETRFAANDSSTGPRLDLPGEFARVTALEAKIKALISQLENVHSNAASLDLAEGRITDLQRKKELEEARYRYFAATKEAAEIDARLGADHVSNIGKVQAPSPPFRDTSKLQKARAMVLFGSLALALGLAFFIDLYLDPSFKRPGEIEAKLGLPLFVAIPLIGENGKSNLLAAFKKIPLLAHRNGSAKPAAANGAPQVSESSGEKGRLAPAELAPWDNQHVLRPFYEALRDRLIAHFEIKNLTHKPKLVALTSCGQRAGVTTTAAGLAACLSETGDGNVLLVEMNLPHGAAHHFFRGNIDCGLDDALENDKREGAMVQDNLYVVAETSNGGKLPRILPRRFHHLMPKLKASDYDYIIFDLPPISQISATQNIARFMDTVLVVVESEKTDRQVVKRGIKLLSESNAEIGIVMNKRRTYVPDRLHQEL